MYADCLSCTQRTTRTAARAASIRPRRARTPACRTTPTSVRLSLVLGMESTVSSLGPCRVELPGLVRVRVRRVKRDRALDVRRGLGGGLHHHVLPVSGLEEYGAHDARSPSSREFGPFLISDTRESGGIMMACNIGYEAYTDSDIHGGGVVMVRWWWYKIQTTTTTSRFSRLGA